MMATFDNTAGNYRVELFSGENYFMWIKRMKMVLMGKKFWSVVTGEETCPDDGSREEKKEFQINSQNEMATIMMAIDDGSMGAAVDTEYPHVLWEDLKNKYSFMSATDVSTLLTKNLTVKMTKEESIIGYTDRVAEMEKRLVCMGKPQNDEDKLETLLRGLKTRFEGTRDLIRELHRDGNRPVQIIIAKEAEMDAKKI